jgi:HK97 family phage portal protein
LKSLKNRIGAEQKALSLNGQYQIIGGQLTSITDNPGNYIKEGYSVNDIIYSIINLILDKVRVAPWNIYEVKEDSSLKLYRGIQQRKWITAEDYRKSNDLFTKALEPVKNPGKIGELLKYPNEYETFNDFVTNGCGYKLLTGNKYIWADLLEGGANKGLPQNLYIMPSQYVQLKVQGGFPSKVVGYDLSMLAIKNAGFAPEEVLHEKYMNYEWSTNGQQHYGVAPLKAALRLTNRNNSALDASTAKFQNGGLEAVIYPKYNPLNSSFSPEQGLEQMNAMKAKLVSEYTGVNNYGKIATSGYEVGVEKLGLSPVELAIIDAEKWDLRRFCSVFGVPSQLMNDPDNKSFNNAKEGEVALTNRCALPLLTAFRDSLNRKFHTDWGMDKRYVIDFDMSVYSELQEDVADMVKWITPLMDKGLPLNRALELLNLEKVDDSRFDEPWVTQTMGQPISEWDANAVDQALNDQQP